MAKIYRTAAGVVMEKELLLHEAVISNEADTVRGILEDREGLNVDCRNNYGKAPIHLAASRGNIEILDMLIKAECDVEAKDKFGMRALHMAAWYGQQDAVDVLLDAGALASAVDKKQRTLLMMASRSSGSGDSLLEHILSRARLDPAVEARARDCDGCSALHHAARAGEARAIETLARILPEFEIEARDQRGQTALHYACAGGQQEAASRLLDLGASARQQDWEGSTALHLAAANRESRLFGWLLARGSPEERSTLLRLVDRRGYTVLHLAASLGCSLILGELLAELEREGRRDQALEGRCHEGNTPLHLAAQMNQAQACDMLVEAGASLAALNAKMQTPLELATEMGHGQVCRLLAAASSQRHHHQESEPCHHHQHHHHGEAEESSALQLAARSSLASIANMIARTARLDYPSLLIKGTRALFNSPEEQQHQ